MAQTANRNFVNGIFVKRVWQDPDDPERELFSIGVTDEFIESVRALPVNKGGFRNMKMGTQRGDATRMSVWEEDFVPGSQSNGVKTPKTTSTQNTEKNIEFPPITSDDLPF